MEVVDPLDVDMDPECLDEARAILKELHATGKYPALQVCIRRHGEIVLHEALGDYRPVAGGPRRRVDLDTRFAIFSISKSVTATLIHVLISRGQLDVDDLVQWYIPEFGANGKELVTLRHILTHQAGIPMIMWNLDDDLIRDWDGILQRIYDQKPWHPPGRRVGYHILSGGYVLGEIVQRITGMSLREFMHKEVLAPYGFETFSFGIDESEWGNTACSERVDRLPPSVAMRIVNKVTDVDVEKALAVMNRPAVFESVIPAGNIVGTAEETSRFFQILLNGGEMNGHRLLAERQVQRATIEQVLAVADWTLLMTPQRYSLGFMLGRKKTEFNIYGSNTEETFGHLGFSRNIAWADRRCDIAGAIITSGKPVRPTREVWLLREFQNTLRDACLDVRR